MTTPNIIGSDPLFSQLSQNLLQDTNNPGAYNPTFLRLLAAINSSEGLRADFYKMNQTASAGGTAGLFVMTDVLDLEAGIPSKPEIGHRQTRVLT